ncbi:MAG TPA: LysR family transcriptional regulator [Devosiaceae bacterium]|jgi:LysR family nitrogen assimilation transcriptional regulator
MELRHLRYFAAVARAGTVTGAANNLNISQPALTYQLKQVEVELGVKLLGRTSRGVSVTEAGLALLAKAETILSEFESIDATMAPFRRSEARRIVVGMAPTPARMLAADLMEAYGGSGKFTIDIREAFSDDLLKMVTSGEIDCALLYDSPDFSGQVLGLPLVSEPLFAIARPERFEALGEGPIRFTELARLPLVLESAQMAGRRLIDEAAKAMDLAPNIVTASSIAVKKELMARSSRCTVGPIALYADELAAKSLEARLIVEPKLDRTLYFVMLRSHEQALRGLTAQVRRLVRKHIDAGLLLWAHYANPATPST